MIFQFTIDPFLHKKTEHAYFKNVIKLVCFTNIIKFDCFTNKKNGQYNTNKDHYVKRLMIQI